MKFDLTVHSEVASQPYPLLFATISGAHLYGFPSPDSDFDLRGVHILPVSEVVGLDPGRETIEVSAVRDGLEIDLVTHDVKKFFGKLTDDDLMQIEGNRDKLLGKLQERYGYTRAQAEAEWKKFSGQYGDVFADINRATK